MKEIDGRVRAIEDCILRKYSELGETSQEQQAEWHCWRRTFSSTDILKRECLIIKIVEPYKRNPSCEEYDWQLLPIKVADALCISKGLTPTEKCPCMWRTLIQDENVIITPPAIYLWELGRMMTSCNNIWASPFSECLSH